MSMVAGIIGSALIGAGASAYGSSQAAKANKKALALQKQQYQENVGRAQPYLDAGNASLEQYRNATGLNGDEAQQAYYDNFKSDPGWEAAQERAMSLMERGASARSMGLSGNTLAALYDYGLPHQLEAFRDRMGQFGNTINWGQNALNTITGAGQNFATGASNAMTNIGNAQAGGATGVGQAGNDAIQNYLNYMRYNAGNGAGAATGSGFRTDPAGRIVGGI